MGLLAGSAAQSQPQPNPNPCTVHIPVNVNSALTKRALDGLKSGSVAVLIRHGEAIAGDLALEDIEKGTCEKSTKRAKVRWLTPAGRSALLEIRAAVELLAPTPAKILHSPSCRTTQTARLLGGSSVPENASKELESRAGQTWHDLEDLVTKKHVPGEVLFLVTHSPNITALTGVEWEPKDMNQGDARAFLIDKVSTSLTGRQRCIGYLGAKDWKELVKRFREDQQRSTRPMEGAP